MHVKSMMIPFESLHVLKTQDTVGEALAHIDSANLLSLPVIDSNKKFVGVLSKRYLYEAYFKETDSDKESFLSLPVENFMRIKLPVTEENIYIEDAALLLFENKMQFLPIVDEDSGELKGIITSSSLLSKYRSIFGMKYPRLVMYVYDFKGTMAEIINIITKEGGSIKNIVQVDTEVLGFTEITLRIDCKDIKKVVKHLERHKFEIREFSE